MKNLSQKIKSQEFKFAAIGGLNTLLDIAILTSLTVFFGFDKIPSNIISTGITFVISFVLNKNITFQSSASNKKSLFREVALFTGVTLFGLWVIQSSIIWAVSKFLTTTIENSAIITIIAKIPATIASLIWNFLLYKKVVFKK